MAGQGDRDIARRTALASIGATAALGALAPFSALAGEDWAEVQAAAGKEGRLVFYHNLRPQGGEPLLAAFRKANLGIQTEHIRLGSAPLIERFSTECNAGRNLADVMITRGKTGWSARSWAACI